MAALNCRPYRLVPNYGVVFQQNPLGFRRVATDLAVSPGESIDLGTIDITSDVRPEPVRTKAAAGRGAGASSGSSTDGAASAAPATDEATDDQVTIPGRVLDAAGNPVEGAIVRVVRWFGGGPEVDHRPLAETTSDREGRFAITYHKSQFKADVDRPERWKRVAVAASKPGQGSDAVLRGKKGVPDGEQAELRLPGDDLAITGRLLDLEGRPLAGVTVACDRLRIPTGEDLSAWIAAVKHGDSSLEDQKHFRGTFWPEVAGLTPQQTDADGRFRLAGIGRERALDLVLEGPRVARTQVTVVTRPMAPLAQTKQTVWTAPEGYLLVSNSQEKTPVLGADFEIAVPPTRSHRRCGPRCENRRRPRGCQHAQLAVLRRSFPGQTEIRAVSDAEGRFRLVGMPKGPGNRIVAIPNDEQPYLMRVLDVPDEPGLEPAKVEVELHRGVWITGRVTNQRTGEPVPLAELYYLPLRSNEHARALPEFLAGESARIEEVFYYDERYHTAADGTYRLVGLPGPGDCRSVGMDGVLLLAGPGCERHPSRQRTSKGEFATFQNPRRPGKKWPTAMKEIDPAGRNRIGRTQLCPRPGQANRSQHGRSGRSADFGRETSQQRSATLHRPNLPRHGPRPGRRADDPIAAPPAVAGHGDSRSRR